MALTDLQLLPACANFVLYHAAELEQHVHKELETSGATRHVMALRMLRLQRAVLAIGMFSLFEALLQTKMNWAKPFDELHRYLNQHDKAHLASVFTDYRLAINALKHGQGRSHTELLARASTLDFKVRAAGDLFGEEGDISEVDVLVDADEQFVRRCAELIQEASSFIRSRERVWL
jgi:hypothetical protein